MAYNDGMDGMLDLLLLEVREWTGVMGGVMTVAAGCSIVGCGRLGVARYTSLHAPTPIGRFRPSASLWML